MCSLFPYVLGFCLAEICKAFVYVLTVVIKKKSGIREKDAIQQSSSGGVYISRKGT